MVGSKIWYGGRTFPMFNDSKPTTNGGKYPYQQRNNSTSNVKQ